MNINNIRNNLYIYMLALFGILFVIGLISGLIVLAVRGKLNNSNNNENKDTSASLPPSATTPLNTVPKPNSTTVYYNLNYPIAGSHPDELNNIFNVSNPFDKIINEIAIPTQISTFIGDSILLPAVEPVYSKWKFMGWVDNINLTNYLLTSIRYQAGSLYYVTRNNTTLYAVWKPILT